MKRITWVLFLVACMPARRGTVSPQDSGDAYRLTRLELARVEYLPSVQEAIVRLRPWFLTPRPGSEVIRGEPQSIKVYINGHPAGGKEVLSDLRVVNVEEIQLVRTTNAYSVPGGIRGADAVINVILRRH